MRIELLPLLLGIVALGIGGVLVLDAAIADGTFIPVERRRSQRPPRSRTGEGLVGAAIILLGASLIGRDQWAYTTLSVVLAVLLGAAGVAMNWRYLREMVVAPKARGDATALRASGVEGPGDEPSLRPSDERRPASLS
jgi:hypothetical protein